MSRCKIGYALNEDGTIPQRCHVWDGDFYPTTCKECPYIELEGAGRDETMKNMICNKREKIDLLVRYICKPIYIKGYCWNRAFDGWTVIYRRDDGNLAFDYRGTSYSVEGFLPSRFTMNTSSTYDNAFYNEQINI